MIALLDIVVIILDLIIQIQYAYVQIIFKLLMHLAVRRYEIVYIYIFILYTGSSTTLPTGCTKQCVNGGVCNIVNGQQVCYCQLGFSGDYCEVQGWLELIIYFVKLIFKLIRYSKSLLCWFMSSWKLL